MPLGSMSGRVGEARFPFSSQILFSIYRPRLTASSATCSKVCGTEVDGREAPIRAATGVPSGSGAHACHVISQRSPAQRAPRRGSVWQYGGTPGFLRLAGIWANRCPVPKVELVLVLLRFAEWVQAWHAAAILFHLRLFEFHLFSFGVRLTPHLAVGFREEEVRTRTR